MALKISLAGQQFVIPGIFATLSCDLEDVKPAKTVGM
jgi:hypothetical protein